MLKKVDKILLITSILLFAIGIVMIFSASSVTSYVKDKAPYAYCLKQVIFLVFSFILAWFLIKFPTKSYAYISWLAMIAIIVLLIVVLIHGTISNQAKSWITIIKGVTLQPSEFAKVATIVWLASTYKYNNKNIELKSFLVQIALVLLIAVLIFIQPDLGTMCIYVFIVFFMFTSLPISKKTKRNIFLGIASLVLIVFILLMNNGVQIFFERQLERFDFFNPCSEEKFYDSGSQVCNGYIAINNGGMFGKGLGNSTQKYLYLPEAYTDFIFAIIVEELGLVGGLAILILLFIVLWRIFIIAKQSNNDSSRLMCYGVFWYILLHIIINLGGIMGLMPLTGVPLPFLSYGGSYALSLVLALTFVQRVAIENKTLRKQ